MSFEHEVTVRFHEVDRAGIVFFGRVFEYCHATFEEMLMAAGDELGAVFEEGGWAMPLVHAEADFERPMRMGERLGVSLDVERVGGHSIAFAYTVRGAANGELKATARLVHAFVDLEIAGRRAVPERLLRGLRQLGLLDADGG